MGMFNEFFKKEKPVFTGITRGVGGFGFGASFVEAGGGASGGPGMVASGGTLSDYEASGTMYRAHIFTSSGAFSVTTLSTNPDYGNTVDWLVVGGGGGGGGSWDGGGGGAGGYRTSMPEGPGGPSPSAEASQTIPSTGPYGVTIGAGGNGEPASGNKGGATTFSLPSPIVSQGGGNGRNGNSSNAGNPGASGGGGGGRNYVVDNPGGTGNRGDGTNQPASTPVPNQGYPGGQGAVNDPANERGGGGGGGAGGAGGNGFHDPSRTDSYGYGGQGGKGKASTIAYGPANPRFYACGGGGGGPLGGSTGGDQINDGIAGCMGGYGGNMTRREASDAFGGSGIFGTGSGGGGASRSGGNGGKGAHGCVVVRYKIDTSQLDTKATGGRVVYSGSKTIHVFESSGTFENTSGSPLATEYIVVAGGGSGGSNCGGGGGAGQYLTGPTTIAPGPFNVTIGGGASAVNANSNSNSGGDGTDSSAAFPAGTVTANGGGGGAAGEPPGITGRDGGSGGGGGQRNSRAGGSASPGPGGNDGGASGPGSGARSGGGGGGAGGTGTTGRPDSFGVPGGAGTQIPATFRNSAAFFDGGYGTPYTAQPGPTGPSKTQGTCLAGGGASSGDHDGAAGGSSPNVDEGGIAYGGGGSGGHQSAINDPVPYQWGQRSRALGGMTNTGAGGGAGNFTGPPGSTVPTGAGGSGIVLIAYDT